ncbi:MAG: hypothetical protein WAZ18_07160 [Alphaproteobacteria bacterium]
MIWIARFFFVVALVVCGAVQAQQLGFKTRVYGNAVRFDYVWKDARAVERRLAFTLPVEDLRRGQQEFAAFDNTAMNDAAFQAVESYARTKSTSTMKLAVKRTYNGFEVEAEATPDVLAQGVAKRHVDAMNGVRDKALEAYLYDHFYTRAGDGYVMPDHKRIVQRYGPALAPVQAAIRQATRGMQPREVVDFVMGFLQSIPYDLLGNRATSNGAGFQTPYGLLLGNKGDCDTKSVALLALLRGLFPKTRLTMVYVTEHAFVGVALPRTATDYALNLKGSAFVLADPTGPRLLRLGEVDGGALGELEGGKYSYQEVLY